MPDGATSNERLAALPPSPATICRSYRAAGRREEGARRRYQAGLFGSQIERVRCEDRTQNHFLRKVEDHDRKEQEELLELYKSALGME